MRKNILAAGVTLFVVALLFGLSYPLGTLFTIPISSLNIILGLVTKGSPGVSDFTGENAEVRLVIDRGVIRGNIYELVFLNSKLILKRLSSVMITAGLALVLAIIGLEFLYIIGALMGGVTGFSLQEYLTQRSRNKIEKKTLLAQTGKNDVEVNYRDLIEVRLSRTRLYFTSENNALIVSVPRGYSARLEPSLERIFGSTFVSEESIRVAEASQKEREKSHHPRRDSRQFPRR